MLNILKVLNIEGSLKELPKKEKDDLEEQEIKSEKISSPKSKKCIIQ